MSNHTLGEICLFLALIGMISVTRLPDDLRPFAFIVLWSVFLLGIDLLSQPTANDDDRR